MYWWHLKQKRIRKCCASVNLLSEDSFRFFVFTRTVAIAQVAGTDSSKITWDKMNENIKVFRLHRDITIVIISSKLCCVVLEFYKVTSFYRMFFFLRWIIQEKTWEKCVLYDTNGLVFTCVPSWLLFHTFPTFLVPIMVFSSLLGSINLLTNHHTVVTKRCTIIIHIISTVEEKDGNED